MFKTVLSQSRFPKSISIVQSLQNQKKFNLSVLNLCVLFLGIWLLINTIGTLKPRIAVVSYRQSIFRIQGCRFPCRSYLYSLLMGMTRAHYLDEVNTSDEVTLDDKRAITDEKKKVIQWRQQITWIVTKPAKQSVGA